jgi:selenocysteine lyase/cysteine desulfurase
MSDLAVVEPAAYLNNAAEGWPRAPGVSQAVRQALEDWRQGGGRSTGEEEDPVEQTRRTLAEWLGVSDPTRIVFAGSATLALNLAILGLPPERFRRVLTTVTEHNSVLRPLLEAVTRYGGQVHLVDLESSGRLDREGFESALGQKPTLVALNHASNVTGQINPIEPLLEAAHRAGAVTLLDASQSVGYLKLRPAEWPLDLMAFGGQKGLHGPPGIGVLYVSRRLELQPLYSGGTGVHSELLRQPPQMPLRLEAGTANTPALLGLQAAVRWQASQGEAFAARAAEAGRRLRQGLEEMARVRIYSPPGPRLGVISFRLPGWECAEAAWVLRRSFRVACRAGLHCAPLMHRALGSFPEGTIRFSVSGFTGPEEVEAALDAVRRMAR